MSLEEAAYGQVRGEVIQQVLEILSDSGVGHNPERILSY